MNKNKITIGIIVGSIFIVGILAAIHLASRPLVPTNHILLKQGDETFDIDIDSFQMGMVEGKTVNAKGDIKIISGEGILLRDAISDVDIGKFDEATVVSDDEYHAIVKESEIFDSDNVYLLRQDSGIRMCVFGDDNSKRNVTNVVKISFN